MKQRYAPGQVVKHKQGTRGHVCGLRVVVRDGGAVRKLLEFVDQVKIGIAHQSTLERDLVNLGG